MGDTNTQSKAAYRGLCTRYVHDAKTIIEGCSNSFDNSKRLNQLISFMEKQLTEVQTIDKRFTQVWMSLRLKRLSSFPLIWMIKFLLPSIPENVSFRE